MGRLRSLRQRVWEQCEGVCYLCGLSMFPDVDPSNPLAYTIDHIVPKSKDGGNTMDNVSGAHQWCNNAKGDSSIEELPPGFKRVMRWKVKNLLANMTVRKL